MTSTPDAQTKLIPVLIQFGAMTFDTITPEIALQNMADMLAVSTVAIGRVTGKTGAARILAANLKSVKIRAGWPSCENSANDLYIALSSGDTRDTFIIQTSLGGISSEQFAAINYLSPYLVAFWGARKAGFDAALDRERIELTGSILHPDNPYKLTRTEIQICELIAQGDRPIAMVAKLSVSMATIRTHLQRIYAKTGLDGMVGVLHHLRVYSETKDGTE